MAWTSTDLTAIERAIASGELTVRFGDRQIQYRSIDELLRARDLIKSVVDPSVSASTRCTSASFSKE